MTPRQGVPPLPAAPALGIAVSIALSGCFGGTVRAPNSTHAAKASSSRHDRVTLAVVGDTMLGDYPELPADPDSYLDQVKGQLKGDIVFGNLEGRSPTSPTRRSAKAFPPASVTPSGRRRNTRVTSPPPASP
jgi:hypothetical protein